MKRFLLPILLLLSSTTVFSQDPETVATETRISKQSATITGDRGLFTIPSVETLNKGQFSFGGGWNSTQRLPKDLDINAFPIFLSIGVIGRLTVTGSFEPERQITARSVSQTGFYNSYPFVNTFFNTCRCSFTKGIGDTTLSAKYRLQRRRDNIGGISLRSFVKFGTAEKEKGLGTGETDVGADVLFTSLLPWKFLLDSQMGFTATRDGKDPVTGTRLGIKDEMRSGIGVSWPASSPLQGIFEYNTVTFVGAGSPNAAKTIQNPSDLSAGVRYLMLDSGITFSAGYRRNRKFEQALPSAREPNGFVFGISYTKPVRAPGTNHFPVLALEASAEQISPGSSATITATGFDADNDPLTYSWSASGGKISGSGDKVTFDSTGLAPGKYTIRATANDGKGGTVTTSIDVTVR